MDLDCWQFEKMELYMINYYTCYSTFFFLDRWLGQSSQQLSCCLSLIGWYLPTFRVFSSSEEGIWCMDRFTTSGAHHALCGVYGGKGNEMHLWSLKHKILRSLLFWITGSNYLPCISFVSYWETWDIDWTAFLFSGKSNMPYGSSPHKSFCE